MDTIYYRKIAEILVRDEPGSELADVAKRLLATRNPRRSDKKKLLSWMYTWIDRRWEVSLEMYAASAKWGEPPENYYQDSKP